MKTSAGEAIIDQQQSTSGDVASAQASPATSQQRPVRLTVCVEPGAEQHLLQVWTMPRKRVVFDYSPTTNEISTKFTFYNRSNEAYAFKVSSASDATYTANPSTGLVDPGQSVEVSILLNDTKCLEREIEKDTFTIDLAVADADNNSANNFDFHDKRVLFVGISQSVKDRLAYVLAEEQRASVERTKRHRRNVKIAVAVVLVFLLLLVFSRADICDCQD